MLNFPIWRHYSAFRLFVFLCLFAVLYPFGCRVGQHTDEGQDCHCYRPDQIWITEKLLKHIRNAVPRRQILEPKPKVGQHWRQNYANQSTNVTMLFTITEPATIFMGARTSLVLDLVANDYYTHLEIMKVG